jgi:hypothetical protein
VVLHLALLQPQPLMVITNQPVTVTARMVDHHIHVPVIMVIQHPLMRMVIRTDLDGIAKKVTPMKQRMMLYSLTICTAWLMHTSNGVAESRCLYSRLQKITWDGPYLNGFYGSPYRTKKTDSSHWNVVLDIPEYLWHNGTHRTATGNPSEANIYLQNMLASQLVREDISAPIAPPSWVKDSQPVAPQNDSSTKSSVSTLH